MADSTSTSKVELCDVSQIRRPNRGAFLSWERSSHVATDGTTLPSLSHGGLVAEIYEITEWAKISIATITDFLLGRSIISC